ncbi:hypothetical protein J2T09_001619 [Neorhizobium huautlense]|uniref:DKNYY family protein n=1 Tax=Neorhizobium huautlense TaxID=67774 RepID=A0ABT9PT14_9HYPH|nr:DKNYY domain-containing protein [Neorhizobium huautlense]MDP9836874.1 hypothetical protein [Neorhizobium huautlense]
MTKPFAVIDNKVFCVGNDDREPVEIGGGISPDGFAIISAFEDGWLWAGYLRDAKGVWWFHARNRKAQFVTSDADGFRVIDDDYGLDSSHVYLEDRNIPGADPETFALVENGTYFAKDRHRIYVKDGSHFFQFEEIDIETVIANGPLIGDANNLFHHSSSLSSINHYRHREQVHFSLEDEHDQLIGAWLAKHHPDIIGWWHRDYPYSADGAEQISDDWYATDNAVFFHETHEHMRGKGEAFNLLRGADPKSFEALDSDHGRDEKNVFCRQRRIRDADPSSFKALGALFGADVKAVYYNGYRVEGADPASFVRFDTTRAYGKDKTSVYAETFDRTSQPFGHPDHVLAPLEGAQTESFQAFGSRGSWAADAKSVYLAGEHKKKLDAASFRFLCETSTNSWAQDKNGLYRANGTMNVAGIDGASFEKMNDFWGSDGKVVFSFITGAIQKAIDTKTFEVTDDAGGARDANAEYRIENGSIKKKKR